LRNEVLLAQAKSQEVSLAAFDRVTQQLQQMQKLAQVKDAEISRLTELCEKNKIDVTKKPDK